MGAAMLGGAVMAGRASQRAQTQQQDQDAGLDDLEQQGQPQAQAPPPPAAAPAPAASEELAGQIQQLADLNQSGVLSDQEFEAAKQEAAGELGGALWQSDLCSCS
jgi:hypothetical protein